MIYWPVVQQRLVALLPTLTGFTGVKIHDAVVLEDADAKSFVIVGGTTPEDGGRVEAGAWQFETITHSNARAERGTVVCEFAVWGGDETLPAYRATAFDLVDELDAAIRADQTLGVLPVPSTTDLSADVVSVQDSNQAEQRLIVSVSYYVQSYART